MQQSKERRKTARFPVIPGIIVDINNAYKGILKDISPDGFSFRYVEFDFNIPDTEDNLLLASFASKHDLLLDKFPCEIVQTRCPLPDYHLPSDMVFICRAQFHTLPKHLRTELNSFITKFSESPEKMLASLVYHCYLILILHTFIAMKRKNNQRQYPRFKVNRRLLVTLKTASMSRLCIITDISRNGLAFRYMDEIENTYIQGGTRCTLTLCETDGGILISEIPARVVRDCQYGETLSFSLAQMRRCCVHFEEMKSLERAKLDQIILNVIPAGNSEPPFVSEKEEEMASSLASSGA